jgi:hypothetical protein
MLAAMGIAIGRCPLCRPFGCSAFGDIPSPVAMIGASSENFSSWLRVMPWAPYSARVTRLVPLSGPCGTSLAPRNARVSLSRCHYLSPTGPPFRQRRVTCLSQALPWQETGDSRKKRVLWGRILARFCPPPACRRRRVIRLTLRWPIVG